MRKQTITTIEKKDYSDINLFHRRNHFALICLLTAVITFFAFAQYTVEWTSGNLGSYGWGGAWLDVDNDGQIELQIQRADSLIFYNGDYSVSWPIAFPGFTYVSPLTPRDIDGDGRLVPINTDADPSGELVVIGYRYSTQYEGKIRVYDCATRNLEWESPLLTGLMGSGDCEDLDGDGRAEIIVNRLLSINPANYCVDVYSYRGEGIKGDSYANRFSTPLSSNPLTPSLFPASPIPIYDPSGRRLKERITKKGIYFINYKGRKLKVIVD